jgi:hypothetical protein
MEWRTDWTCAVERENITLDPGGPSKEVVRYEPLDSTCARVQVHRLTILRTFVAVRDREAN